MSLGVLKVLYVCAGANGFSSSQSSAKRAEETRLLLVSQLLEVWGESLPISALKLLKITG